MTNAATPIHRALVSVSDKTGLAELARALEAAGVELISTGGTAAAIRDAGAVVRDVSDLTGMPEMLDGRVKTLHPAVHGGLLGRRADPGHVAAMAEHGIAPIDLLVVNLYPFEDTVARGADAAQAIETIDIGGPAMIRAAAKNHADVAVVVDPEDYAPLLDHLREAGGTTMDFRRHLALTAFARTAAYDAAISGWLAGALQEATPRRRSLAGRLAQPLRYGENPHQRAAFYTDGSARPGVATARQVQGKPLSYNNIADTDAAFELVSELHPGAPACVIVKHANPCGVATDATLAHAHDRAAACDRVSAFGGIVALNRPLDAATARAIADIFTEVVIAPGADDAARAILSDKPNLRLLLTDALADPRAPRPMMRQVAGGFLVQDADAGHVTASDLTVATRRAPDQGQIADLMFAWIVAKHVKSNAIVFARDGQTVGIGAGQTSRVDSARIAVRKARDMAAALGLPDTLLHGAAMASDAFFPFPDALLTAAEAGATSVIQPGGSMRDDAVIAAADEADLAMVLTGQRHFRH